MLRFRDRPPMLAWLYTSVLAASMATGVWALAIGITRRTGGVVGVGVLFIAASAPFLLLIVARMRWCLLSETTLSMPKLFGRREIGLADVANVALLREIGKRTAWFLVVWTADGEQHRVGVATPTKLGKRWREELTGDYLQDSRAGRAAVAIWQRAGAVQGGSGPLGRVPVADRLRYEPTTSAYWTPAGGGVEQPRDGSRSR